MKTKLWGTINVVVAVSLLLMLRVVPVSAATTSIVGGTYGTSCGSGGYFTPSSVTINSGDKVTISVPSNDPYAPGMEVHGFPQGNFTITPGHSFTTNALTADVSYHGTWPSSGCMKGSGTITVKAATPPSTPPPSGGSSGTTAKSSSSSKSTATTPKTTPSKPATTNTSTSPSPQPATTTAPTSDSSTTTTPTTKNQPSTAATTTTGKSPATKNAAAFGAGGLAIIVIGLFFGLAYAGPATPPDTSRTAGSSTADTS